MVVGVEGVEEGVHQGEEPERLVVRSMSPGGQQSGGLIADLTTWVRLWEGVSLWVSVSAKMEALPGGLNVLLGSSSSL